jgi:hypothetical protein
MDLNTFIVADFCLIDDQLKDLGRLRARGPTPTLCDSEVLTIEVVGEFLGLDEDTENSLRTSGVRLHPLLLLPEPLAGASHHLRQAGGQPLWKIKERLWQELLADTPHDDPAFAICDSMPFGCT